MKNIKTCFHLNKSGNYLFNLFRFNSCFRRGKKKSNITFLFLFAQRELFPLKKKGEEKGQFILVHLVGKSYCTCVIPSFHFSMKFFLVGCVKPQNTIQQLYENKAV